QLPHPHPLVAVPGAGGHSQHPGTHEYTVPGACCHCHLRARHEATLSPDGDVERGTTAEAQLDGYGAILAHERDAFERASASECTCCAACKRIPADVLQCLGSAKPGDPGHDADAQSVPGTDHPAPGTIRIQGTANHTFADRQLLLRRRVHRCHATVQFRVSVRRQLHLE